MPASQFTLEKFNDLKNYLIANAEDLWDTSLDGIPDEDFLGDYVTDYVIYRGDIAWVWVDPDTSRVYVQTIDDGSDMPSVHARIYTEGTLLDMLSAIGRFLRTHHPIIEDDRDLNINFALGRY
jgi:hypothetical protein